MPELTTLLLFAAACTALIAIPGPNAIYIAARSLSQGRSAGVASALGVETGTLVHIAAATVGLSAVVASSATAFDAIRYLGAAYLVLLGIRALRGGGQHADAAERERSSLRRDFAEGVLVNVLNPKVALFFLAFLPQFTDPAAGPVATQTLVLGAVMFVIALAADLLYALGADALGARLRRRPGAARRQGRLTGGIYLALGAVAALSGGHRGR
jgi:threonine/homoserine/homoserine lactone efflux protein